MFPCPSVCYLHCPHTLPALPMQRELPGAWVCKASLAAEPWLVRGSTRCCGPQATSVLPFLGLPASLLHLQDVCANCDRCPFGAGMGAEAGMFLCS